MKPTILDLEIAAFKAWPALRVVREGDWLWRWGQGYTKRANSLNFLRSDDGRNAAARLDHMAIQSVEAGIPFVVRSSPLTPPEVLHELEQRGMEPFEESIVLLRALDSFQPSSATGPALRHWRAEDLEQFHIACQSGATAGRLHLFASEVNDESWLMPQIYLSGYNAARAQGLRAICAAMAVPAIGLTLFNGSATPVASCIVVIVHGIAFLNNVVTDAAQRRKGYGRMLLDHALSVGIDHGAQWAAHPVIATNVAARALYAAMGYGEEYRYVYYQAG